MEVVFDYFFGGSPGAVWSKSDLMCVTKSIRREDEMMMNKMNKNNVYLTVKYKLWLKKKISEMNSLEKWIKYKSKG